MILNFIRSKRSKPIKLEFMKELKQTEKGKFFKFSNIEELRKEICQTSNE